MRRLIAPIAALISSLAIVVGANAQINAIPAPNGNCGPSGQAHLHGQRYPTAIEPEYSIWCYPQPAAIAPTRVEGGNDWVDTFDNSAPSILQFNDHDMGYRIFDQFYGPRDSFKVGQFVNVDHWMLDLVDTSQFRLSGGILISPDKTFQFENGKLIVEADGAAGSDGMGGADAYYEIDISPAAQPTGVTVDSLYGYGAFGGIGALGCRLERAEDGGHAVCAMYDNSGRDAGGKNVNHGPDGMSGRVWETQGVGTARTATSVQGGYPDWPIPGTNLKVKDVWRMCANNELDLHCRDRFRMEITKDSIHLLVNGYPVLLIDGLYASNPATGADNRVPDAWLNQGARTYFTSWINGGQHTPTRWHWDRVAINPHDASGAFAAPAAAPSFCLGDPHNTCPDGTPIGSDNAPAPAAPTDSTAGGSAPVAAAPAPAAAQAAIPRPATASQDNGSTIGFEQAGATGQPLNGQYPAGVVDWGTGAWWLAGPWAQIPNNSVSFNGAGPTSASFTMLKDARLVQLDADNGGKLPSTITVSCDGQPTVQLDLQPGELKTIQTNWSGACGRVTLGSSNGWDTNFDSLVIQ